MCPSTLRNPCDPRRRQLEQQVGKEDGDGDGYWDGTGTWLWSDVEIFGLPSNEVQPSGNKRTCVHQDDGPASHLSLRSSFCLVVLDGRVSNEWANEWMGVVTLTAHSSQLPVYGFELLLVLSSQLVVSLFGLNDVDDAEDAEDVIECSEACGKTINTLRTSAACIVITLTFMHIKQKGDTSMSSPRRGESPAVPYVLSALIQMWHF